MHYAQRDVHIPSHKFAVGHYLPMLGPQALDTECRCMTFRVEGSTPEVDVVSYDFSPESPESNGKSINDILSHAHLPNLRRVVVEYVHARLSDLGRQDRLKDLPRQVTELEIYHIPRIDESESELRGIISIFKLGRSQTTPSGVTKLTLVGLSILRLSVVMMQFTKLEELVFGPEHQSSHWLDTSQWCYSGSPELKGACIPRIVLDLVFKYMENSGPERIGRFKKITYRGKHVDVPESEQSRIEELCARYNVSISFILGP